MQTDPPARSSDTHGPAAHIAGGPKYQRNYVEYRLICKYVARTTRGMTVSHSCKYTGRNWSPQSAAVVSNEVVVVMGELSGNKASKGFPAAMRLPCNATPGRLRTPFPQPRVVMTGLRGGDEELASKTLHWTEVFAACGCRQQQHSTAPVQSWPVGTKDHAGFPAFAAVGR